MIEGDGNMNADHWAGRRVGLLPDRMGVEGMTEGFDAPRVDRLVVIVTRGVQATGRSQVLGRMLRVPAPRITEPIVDTLSLLRDVIGLDVREVPGLANPLFLPDVPIALLRADLSPEQRERQASRILAALPWAG